MSLHHKVFSTLLGACGVAIAVAAHAAPPDRASAPIPDPGKALASSDDTSAIAVNPANLTFLPAPELRWTWVWPSSGSPLPARGHAIGVGLPLWAIATGLRLDLFDPPESAPAPFDTAWRWVRWAVAVRPNDRASIGTTFGWGSSSALELDGHFSVTSGITVRPYTFLSLSAVARDWNEPANRLGQSIARSYDIGLALRPVVGRRDLEVGLETAYFEDGHTWVPRATLGIDIPRVGRLRGDVTLRDLDTGGPKIAAMAGLDLNIDRLQLSGGAVFGDAITRSGAGFYAGAAIRAFREPGVRLPARVVKLRIETTPGVRAHTYLLRRLWRIADDPEIEGVALVIRAEPASSVAHAEEIGDAIRAIRVRGKKVLCHLEDAGGRSLHVCSQADAIAMNPAGGLRFSGISSRYYYFGGLLQKLGVQADFVRIGAHKLAAEQLTNTKGSPVSQVDHQDLVDRINDVFLHDVGGGRRIPRGELARRIARGPFLASEARDAGLIDMLAYEDELDRVVDEMMGHKSRLVDDNPVQTAPERWGKEPKIAVIYLDGNMIDGESQSIPFVGVHLAGSVTVANALQQAREDKSVRAVVFRIETGGGSSLAADVILREAILTARAKPLVVSMGSHAASGGYYAAVAGHPIFANRSTVTGSIGIFYGKVDVSGLLGKLGIRTEGFRTAPRADAESFFRPFTDDERQQLGIKVKQFYDLFIARVAEGRRMKPEAVDAIARGRVWTGVQAHDRHLVDRLGGLREALAEARLLGGVADDAPILSLPEDDDSLLGFLLDVAGASAGASPGALGAAAIPPALLDMARALTPFLVFESNKPLARMELVPEISFGGPTSAPER